MEAPPGLEPRNDFRLCFFTKEVLYQLRQGAVNKLLAIFNL